MNPPDGIDPFSVFVHFLGTLVGPSSFLVWIVIIINAAIGWVVFVMKAASITVSTADRIAANRSRIPRFLVLIVIQSTFIVTGIMIALQWGEIEIYDLKIDATLQFLGGDFTVARTSLSFWALMVFNVVILGIAIVDSGTLKFGIAMPVLLGVAIILVIGPHENALLIHAIYAAAAILTLGLSQRLIAKRSDYRPVTD